jgi:flagellar FliL protein
MADELEPREEREEKEEAKEVPRKKTLLKYIVLGGVVVVLAAGGYVGWNLFEKRKKDQPVISRPPSERKKDEPTVNYNLDPFIVNLMDKAGLGKRYLKVEIVLELRNEVDKRKIDQHKPQLKDAILMLLSSYSYQEISTMEGKLELKQALLSRVNRVFGEGVVRKMYFTDFVVQ